jgi:Cu+-exporting ATPase
MKCAGCASTVKQALTNLPGVISVEINLPSGAAVVHADDDSPSLESMIAAVKKAGYQATA